MRPCRREIEQGKHEPRRSHIVGRSISYTYLTAYSSLCSDKEAMQQGTRMNDQPREKTMNRRWRISRENLRGVYGNGMQGWQ